MHQVSGSELFKHQVSEVVHFKLVCLKSKEEPGVVLFNLFEVLDPNSQSVVSFLFGVIVFSVEIRPRLENVLVVYLVFLIIAVEADGE